MSCRTVLMKANNGNCSLSADIVTTNDIMLILYLRDEIQSSLSLLLLQLKGDTADGASLNSLHQVGDEAGNLISHSLGRNDGNLAGHSLVGVEIKSELGVVLLDNHTSGLLDGLCTNSLQIDVIKESIKPHPHRLTYESTMHVPFFKISLQ